MGKTPRPNANSSKKINCFECLYIELAQFSTHKKKNKHILTAFIE